MVAAEGLRARGLTVERGAHVVLRGVDVALEPGQYWALVGPNGSGKTTLLRALKGMIPVSSGDVTIGDSAGRPFDTRVGLVLANPEDQVVCPVVEDDVAFGLENLRLSPVEMNERVTQTLARVGLAPLRRMPTNTLSGGQTQKVALASVLAMGARFLLLDEATSMLSPWERDDICRLVRDLCAEGVAVLHVTHELEELLLCDHVLALEAGSVVFQGRTQDFLRENPLGYATDELGVLASWTEPDAPEYSATLLALEAHP